MEPSDLGSQPMYHVLSPEVAKDAARLADTVDLPMPPFPYTASCLMPGLRPPLV